MCEVLNRQLLDGRDKPIITCLEFIRHYLMKRIVTVQQKISKSDGPLTPNATKVFNFIKKNAADVIVTWNGGDRYQATGPHGDQCVVNMNQRTCSCKKWELTGMPCKHAVACIWDMASNGMDPGLPETWVSECYWLSTWQEMYRFKVNPTRGPDMWEKSSSPITITPPNYHPPVGRPPKKRRKSAAEIYDNMVKNGQRLSRQGKSITCKNCGQSGHNKRSCKGQRGQRFKPSQPSSSVRQPATNVNPSPPVVNPSAPNVNPSPPVVNPSAPNVNPSPSVVRPSAPTRRSPRKRTANGFFKGFVM